MISSSCKFKGSIAHWHRMNVLHLVRCSAPPQGWPVFPIGVRLTMTSTFGIVSFCGSCTRHCGMSLSTCALRPNALSWRRVNGLCSSSRLVSVLYSLHVKRVPASSWVIVSRLSFECVMSLNFVASGTWYKR